MTPEEVLGKIINHEMMESEAKYVKSLSKGTSTSKGQDIALEANKKEKSKKVVQESSSSDNNSDSSSLDDEDMAFLKKNFSKLMRNRNYKGNKRHESSKRRTKRNCYNCGKSGHFIANCPYEKREDKKEKRKDNKEKKYFTKDKKFFKKKQSGEAHLGKEWYSDDESSNSDEEEVATLAFNKTSLFPNLKDGKNITHTYLMARGGLCLRWIEVDH
ncbi:hypothetical protein PAHAL_5G283300 [Panicum hallii]|uniref:CCHC-type domain-containing protein n=1 Tax=Panicum hallii TaxID=206008 RepID=A0A2T8ILI1_9POAL|nr:hypothetical protein PAHAL_5G283300 [Panicum hallii]